MKNDPILSSLALYHSEAATLLSLHPRYFERHRVSPAQEVELVKLLNNGPHDCVEPKRFKPQGYRNWAVCPAGTIGYEICYLRNPSGLIEAHLIAAMPFVFDVRRRYIISLRKRKGLKLSLEAYGLWPFERDPPRIT